MTCRSSRVDGVVMHHVAVGHEAPPRMQRSETSSGRQAARRLRQAPLVPRPKEEWRAMASGASGEELKKRNPRRLRDGGELCRISGGEA